MLNFWRKKKQKKTVTLNKQSISTTSMEYTEEDETIWFSTLSIEHTWLCYFWKHNQ